MSSSVFIKNIARLLQVEQNPPFETARRGTEMKQLPFIDHAFLLIENGNIADFGSMEQCPTVPSYYTVIDAKGGYVLPTWCDSHTHIVFAATREEEFVYKIQGMSYEDIAAKGGGILNSARKLQAMSEDELFEQALHRLRRLIALGTGAIEIKSGYGLSTDAELKMLRVIRRLKAAVPIPVKATFLGAHAFPQAYRHDRNGYIRLIIEEMLPQIAAEQLADYCDVFCDKGFFTPEESKEILQAARRYGLKAKVHANELGITGGVQVAVENAAISADHLECMDEAAIAALANSDTFATLLPACAFFLGLSYAPARQLMEANVPVAIATDFNPGTSPTGNMNFVVSLACIKMKMLPEEAINAATLNGAAAMELQHECGTIARGKRGNVIITKPIPALAYLPYNFGDTSIARVLINGSEWFG